MTKPVVLSTTMHAESIAGLTPERESLTKSTLGGSVGCGVETNAFLSTTLLAEIGYDFDLADAYSTQ